MSGSEKIEKQAEKEVIEFTNKLKLELPGGHVPVFIKLIAALTAIGGLSIMGGLLTNVFTPEITNFWLYIVRVVIGVAAIASAYAIIRKSMWGVWFYVFLVVVGLIFNPITAILPLIVFIYLFVFARSSFNPSLPDIFLAALYHRLKKIYLSRFKSH